VRTLCDVADEAFREDPELQRQYPRCPAACGESAAALITFVPDRPGHDRRYAINCAKIQGELGYKAKVTLNNGLRDTFAWYVRNEARWRGVMDGSYQQWLQLHYHARPRSRD